MIFKSWMDGFSENKSHLLIIIFMIKEMFGGLSLDIWMVKIDFFNC